MLGVSHGGLSEGIRDILSTAFDSVVLVADETSLLACLTALHPELLVLDLALPRRGGIGLAGRLRTLYPELRILLLVADGEPAVDRVAAAAGADGCVLKQTLADDLMPAVERVLAGRTAFWAGGPGGAREPDESAGHHRNGRNAKE